MTNHSRDDHQPDDGTRTLSVADDSIRAVRDHVRLAKVRIESALGYVMYPEVREELRKARSHLALTLTHIGG